MNNIREKIYMMIEPHADDENIVSKGYDIVMIITIVVSLIPLLLTKPHPIVYITDKVTVIIFIIDYILRLITADFKYQKSGAISFLRYPFSPLAIIDLLTILPSLTALHNVFKALRLVRLFKALKVIRILTYSRNVQRLKRVLKKQRYGLITVLGLICGYVFISALIVFQVEPQSFDDFFEALYWATISLTTIGYGDIVTTTHFGQFITMVSSVAGIAIIALPTGIITAGYLEEMQEEDFDPNLRLLPSFLQKQENRGNDPRMKQEEEER